MKSLSQVMQGIPTGAQPQPAATASDTTATIEKKHIVRLWERMKKIYGSTWVREFGAADDGTWLQGLQGVTPAQLGLAITKCAASGKEFPPALPKFREMCAWASGDLRLPSAGAAYREACHNAHRDRNDHVWSHAVVWHAARAVGFEVLFASAEAKPAFEREYQQMITRVANGESIEEPPAPTLRRSSVAPLTPHAIKAADAGIAAMRHVLRGGRNA